MALTEQEVRLLEECIEAHTRMIKHHREQILDLRRKMEVFEKQDMIPNALEIKK